MPPDVPDPERRTPGTAIPPVSAADLLLLLLPCPTRCSRVRILSALETCGERAELADLADLGPGWPAGLADLAGLAWPTISDNPCVRKLD